MTVFRDGAGYSMAQKQQNGALTTPKRSTSIYFESFDILRGFAAISVLVYHVIEHTKWQNLPSNWFIQWFEIGWMGVDLFFALSGFVIMYSSLNLFAKRPESFKREYIGKRLRRIVPLYYLTCGAFLVTNYFFGSVIDNLPFHVVMYFFFIHNISLQSFGVINGANWSVGIEMQYYALMLVLVPWISSASLRVWTAIPTMVGISWLWRAFAFNSLPMVDGNVHPLFVKVVQLPGVLDGFAFGMAAAYFVFRYGPTIFTKNRIVVALICLATVYSMFDVFWRNSSYWDSYGMVVFFRTLLSLSCVSVLLLFAAFEKLFSARIFEPLRYLGRISYGIYLWHLIVIMLCKNLPGLSNLEFLGLTMLGTLLLSALSFEFFEKRFLKI